LYLTVRRVVVALTAAAFALSAVEAATALRATSAPLAGKISYGTFASKALDGTVNYSVYFPPGYDLGATRYPVVYFLHGLPAPDSAYRSITPLAQALEQAGERAILVGVQGARSDDSDPEWLDWGPGRNWETATAKELVRVVDGRYRTIAGRAGRVLIGTSAGGYGATLIALHNPGVYAAVESWSGYFRPTTPDGTADLDLGSKASNDWADAHKQIRRIQAFVGAGGSHGFFGFYVGSNDSLFRPDNVKLWHEIRSAGISGIIFRIYSGGHGWSLWSSHAAGWLSRALAAAAAPR
jgi:enterochelin esterase-like enzyme